MRKTLLFIGLFLLNTFWFTAHAQVTQEWVRKFVGFGNDNPAGIAADNLGNVYIIGNNNWGFSTSDIYLVRYNAAGLQTGGILYNSPYNNADQAVAVATDVSGNVYVAGTVSVNASTSDIVVIKYNSSMTQQWVTIFNTPENYIDDVNAMKLDAAGNIYLTGSIVKGAFEYDYLTVKLNSSGTVMWHATYNGTANGIDIANDIAVDASGNVFVTGASTGVARRGRIFTLSSFYDVVTIKYDPNGVQQWVQRYNLANRNDEGNAIALDATGNVYVTGFANSSVNRDCVTLKYTNDGILQWVQLFNGAANQHDEARKIAIDGSGNVLISGYTNNNATGSSDLLAIKYNSIGALQWTGIFSAASNTADQGRAMGLDQFGNVYVAGETSVPGTVNADFITVKFTSAGSLAWSARYNGPENQTDFATSIAVVNSRIPESLTNATVYVYGFSNNDVITIKYSQPTVIEPPIFLTPQKNETSEARTQEFRTYYYPNPFNSYTNIYYQLPQNGKIIVTLHDGLGRKLATIVEGSFAKGIYSKRLETSTLPSGEYYYKIIFRSAGKETIETKKLILQR